VSLPSVLGLTLLRLQSGPDESCFLAASNSRCQGPRGISGFGPALSP
jgi:hypothetical protein